MKRKILLTFSLLLLFGATSVMAQTNIGYMSTNKVLMQLPKTQEIQQSLNEIVQQKQAKLQKKTTAFQDAVADYQANKGSMSQSEITQTENELRALRQELTTFNQKIRQTIQKKRNDMLLPVLEAIDAAIASVAEAKGLDLVINKTTNAGANVLFYTSDSQENITQEVLEKVKSTLE